MMVELPVMHGIFHILALIPPIALVVVALIDVVVLASIFIRWNHIVMSKWDVLMLAISIIGVLFFDLMLVLFSGTLCETDLIGISRAMRLISLLAVFWIAHMAIVRQRKLGKIGRFWK